VVHKEIYEQRANGSWMWRSEKVLRFLTTHQRLALAHVLAPKEKLPIQVRHVDRVEINL
jgi:hypothetical protein